MWELTPIARDTIAPRGGGRGGIRMERDASSTAGGEKAGRESEAGQGWISSPALSLYVVSFAALFLELMVIRWVPSTVLVVAYYANLMLISSFLGLGLGALVARRGFRLFRWFPLLLAVGVGLFVVFREIQLPGSPLEMRFFADAPKLSGWIVLLSIFVANAAVFVPLGERVGQLFHALPPLRAYAWDLAGSLSGTIAFAAFSFFAFSPVIGLGVVAALFLLLSPRRALVVAAPALLVVVAFVGWATPRPAIWSPYHYISVHDMTDAARPRIDAPAPNILQRTDPPFYQVRVNQMFYQSHGTIALERYAEGTDGLALASDLLDQYRVPHAVHPGAERVLVVGAGGGLDAEAALLAGAERVDAVEIDQTLVDLSRRFNASGVYDDPRVTVHVDDARAFLRRTDERYDAVVFGYLDSQALSTTMASIRLDGFVYTIESLASAWNLVDEPGILSLSFYVSGRPWLVEKLVQMAREATGTEPAVYTDRKQVIVVVPKGEHSPPSRIGPFQRVVVPESDVPLATDDWPYLYLAERSIPGDYLWVIAALLAVSVGFLAVAKPRGTGPREAHFLFLGLGFLLLQTSAIVDSTLYFGSTWLIATTVIAGVLLMIFLSNLVAMRMAGPHWWIDVVLLASVGALYLVPSDAILQLPLAGRVAWVLLAVPLPIFFAGLLFSTTFRLSPNPSAAFGANLIGATLGGFCEYLGMVIGRRDLLLVVIVAYLLSLACRKRLRD